MDHYTPAIPSYILSRLEIFIASQCRSKILITKSLNKVDLKSYKIIWFLFGFFGFDTINHVQDYNEDADREAENYGAEGSSISHGLVGEFGLVTQPPFECGKFLPVFRFLNFGKFLVGALQVVGPGEGDEVFLGHDDWAFEIILVDVDVDLGFEGVVVGDDGAVLVCLNGGDSRDILDVLGSISTNIEKSEIFLGKKNELLGASLQCEVVHF